MDINYTCKIKAYRSMYSIKQNDMADLLGIGLNTYNFKENGRSSFTLDESKKVADFFNTTVDEIFFNKEVNFENTIRPT